MTGYGPTPMQVESVGELIDLKTCWHLVYDRCGHVQVLARLGGLEDAGRVRAYVRRYYARCLICEVEQRHKPKLLPPPAPWRF